VLANVISVEGETVRVGAADTTRVTDTVGEVVLVQKVGVVQVKVTVPMYDPGEVGIWVLSIETCSVAPPAVAVLVGGPTLSQAAPEAVAVNGMAPPLLVTVAFCGAIGSGPPRV
jgi:hypothetical protein